MQYQLKNLAIPAFIGVYEHEKGKTQTLIVNVWFQFESHKAALSDDLKATVDYSQIEALVKQVCLADHYQLLERLHRALVQSLEDQFPKIKGLKVSLEKFPFESGSIVLQ
jgi:dihydroneopterin aldolase